MQSSIGFVVSLVLLSSALASYDSSTKLRRDGVFSNKLRRDGVLNLYPFPRVGRASNTWQVPLKDILSEYERAQKRQLYAFPRVGRSDLSLMRGQGLQGHRDLVAAPVPRNTEDEYEYPGMWFGPRLGRSFKSDEDDITIQNDHSEPEQTESINNNREKREVNLF